MDILILLLLKKYYKILLISYKFHKSVMYLSPCIFHESFVIGDDINNEGNDNNYNKITITKEVFSL